MKWENAYIFISSTFNDMHAERDILVKRVFPDLRLWCHERKIKLIDIDLRWGVSEEDATNNKKVVDICLKNIDKCRPFFLCFLGQRRGWVPMDSDIHPDTVTHYPGLSKYIGKQSITELEIIHALLEPLKDAQIKIPTPLFYFRKPDYLKQISGKEVYNIYSSEKKAVKQLERFKKSIKKIYPVFEYTAKWDDSLTSSELKGIGAADLTCGRLTQFSINEISMAQHVLERLKEAIAAEFPDHLPVTEEMTTLQKELDWQDSYLSSLTDSYIRRPEEEDKLLKYINGNTHKPYILEANAGTGKTSLLAYLLTQLPPDRKFYRFIGTSQESSDIQTMLNLLYEEFGQAELLSKAEADDARSNCLINFQNVLTKISAKQPVVLVLDAIDQFRYSEELPFWIPTLLPENVKLIISLKTDEKAQRNQYLHQGGYEISTLHDMSEESDKRRMIEEYLGQYLKTVDEKQIQLLLAMKGSSNPLYLKIILNELRIHGSFESLQEKLESNYGSVPQEAFLCVLERMEKETFVEIEHKRELFIIFLTMMAYSLEGLDIPYTANLLVHGVREFKDMETQKVADAMYVIAKHLSPYLILQGKRVDFLYESLRIAAKKRYQGYEKMGRKLLAIGYRILLNSDGRNLRYNRGTSSDLVSLAHQILNHSIEEANTELFSSWFMYEYCKRLGAGALAEQFYTAAKLAPNGPAYEEIANALISVQAKVSVNPKIVFYELKNILGKDHAIFGTILKQVSQMPGFFFQQKNMHEECLMPQKELTRYKKDVLELFLHSDFISYRLSDSQIDSKDSILFQNITDGKIEKIVQFPADTRAFYSHKDYLYVKHSYDKPGFTAYEVPSMKQVFAGTYPECPEGFHWHFGIYGWKDYVFSTCSNEAEDYKVINLRTGQTVWEYTKKETDGYLHEYYYGRLLFISIMNTELLLVDLTNGKIVWNYQGDAYGRFMSDDENGYLLCLKDGHPMWHYVHYEDDQVIVNEEKEMKPYVVGDGYAVINGHLFSFIKNQMWVFDKDMNCLGYQTLPDEMRTLEDTEPVLHRNGNYGIYLSGSVSLKFYSIENLFHSLKKDIENVSIRRLQNQMILDDYLYLFYTNGEIEKVNLNTNQVVMQNKDIPVHYNKDIAFKYWGDRLLVGSYRKGYGDDREYRICMQSARSLKTMIRYSGISPEGYYLREAFFLDGKVGLIFWEHYTREVETTLFGPDGTDFSFQMKKCRILFTSDFQTFEEWTPDFKFAGNAELFAYQDELYLMFDEIYIDDHHIGATVYHIRSRKSVCETILSADHRMYSSQMVIANGSICIYVRRYDTVEKKNHRYYYLFDFLTGAVQYREHPKGFDVDGYNRDELYLTEIESNTVRQKIMVISSKTGDIQKTIPCTNIRGMDTKIIKKYGGYLVYYATGITEIYTDDSDGPVFSQVLTPGTLIDRPDTADFIIAATNGLYYVYTLDKIQNLFEE